MFDFFSWSHILVLLVVALVVVGPKDLPKLMRTAGQWAGKARAAADLVGVGHLSFGTDHPFSVADPQANLRAIREAFSQPEAAQVLAGSAIDLYGIEKAD